LQKAELLFSSNEFAAIILEPLVQGSAGMRMYSADFLTRLVNLAKQHEVKVILDEVMTAWGRTGTYFAFQHTEIVPDIICLSKGLTGGVLPLGLTVTTNEIYDAFLSDEKAKALLHGHSFTGNPLSCAASCASLDIFEEQSTWENIRRIARANERFAKELTSLAVEEARCSGTILAIELKVSGESSYFSTIRDEAYAFFLDKGMLLRPCGNVIFINPPYCITDNELCKVHGALLAFISLQEAKA
jgi:adenosylmethionine-8-amino-7-oxononanoate aminotransferase